MRQMLLVTGYWSLVTGYWLLVTGYWLLVTGYWLLATGYWLLATGYWCHWSLVQGSTDLGAFDGEATGGAHDTELTVPHVLQIHLGALLPSERTSGPCGGGCHRNVDVVVGRSIKTPGDGNQLARIGRPHRLG